MGHACAKRPSGARATLFSSCKMISYTVPLATFAKYSFVSTYISIVTLPQHLLRSNPEVCADRPCCVVPLVSSQRRGAPASSLSPSLGCGLRMPSRIQALPSSRCVHPELLHPTGIGQRDVERPARHLASHPVDYFRRVQARSAAANARW